MANRCSNCGDWNTNDALRCASCNFPFTYWTWYSEYGFAASMRAGAIISIVIAAVAFPVTIGTMIVLSRGLGVQWMALAIAVSVIDAVILFALKDRLMRIGWIGPYERKDW